jgi:hypothetical protein
MLCGFLQDLARPEVQRALCCGPDERSPTAAQAEAARSAAAATQQQQQGGALPAVAASSTAVTPDGVSAAATPAAPGSAGAGQGLSRASSSGNCPLITPAVTPGASGSVLQGGMFMRRPSSSGGGPSSSGGGHSSSGGGHSSSGGLLSLIGASSGGSAAVTGPNTAVSSPNGVLAVASGVLPAPLLGSTTGGGHGTPPISPSSLADAVGPSGLRRPSPPVSACGPGSAMSGGGSSAGSRWGSRGVSALSSAETGELHCARQTETWGVLTAGFASRSWMYACQPMNSIPCAPAAAAPSCDKAHAGLLVLPVQLRYHANKYTSVARTQLLYESQSLHGALVAFALSYHLPQASTLQLLH